MRKIISTALAIAFGFVLLAGVVSANDIQGACGSDTGFKDDYGCNADYRGDSSQHNETNSCRYSHGSQHEKHYCDRYSSGKCSRDHSRNEVMHPCMMESTHM